MLQAPEQSIAARMRLQQQGPSRQELLLLHHVSGLLITGYSLVNPADGSILFSSSCLVIEPGIETLPTSGVNNLPISRRRQYLAAKNLESFNQVSVSSGTALSKISAASSGLETQNS